MYPKLLVSSGQVFGQTFITIQEMTDRKTISWSYSWPISYFESTDWASWATWAGYTPDARVCPMPEGWMLSIPIAQVHKIDYTGIRYHDSHRKAPGDDTKYHNLALLTGYRVSDVPFIF